MMSTSESTLLFQEDLYTIHTRVIVVIAMPWNELPDDEQVLLGKILGSVRLTPAAVKIIERKSFSLADLKIYSPHFVIAFGCVYQESTKMYEVIPSADCPVLCADALSKLDDVKKKNLWNALKQLFKP